ncbi:PREDICTED: endogenous retrovirus group K member 5 Gag polyprotein-like, partial [Condylura cristata]|uniref:endogenous retrovirus group K member 5 Gag polyprotein-like n=1 Tax=Condylura cristata TaxID=143302 RepID=UPI00064326B3
MGQHMSKNETLFVSLLKRMLASRGFKVTDKVLNDFVAFLVKVSPWFLEIGELNPPDWKHVGREMRQFAQKNGEHTLPAHAFPLWLQLRELIAETSDFEGLIQEKDSISSHTYDEVAEELLASKEGKPPAYGTVPEQTKKGVIAVASAPPAESEDDNDDWDLEEEAAKYNNDEYRDHEGGHLHYPKLTFAAPRSKHKPKHAALPPIGFRGAMAEARKTGDFSFAFPVVDFDEEEPIWEPLPFKVLKELQQAVKSSGPTAPYTLHVLDTVASSWLTPYDWMQTVKATLSPGDYILWRTEYEDLCKESVVQSVKRRGGIKPTINMLQGTGEYAEPKSQVHIPRPVLEEITKNAVRAWRKLPPTGAKGTALATIKQGLEKTYQDFVSRLEEAINRMLPPSEGTDILLKQLAWENANTLCQDLILPIRKTGNIQDYIKACIDASPAVVQGMAYAAAMKGQKFSAYNNEDWIIALQGYAGQIKFHYPRHPVVEFAKKVPCSLSFCLGIKSIRGSSQKQKRGTCSAHRGRS